MPAIPAATLLDSWERGEGQHPLHRPLTLLHAANPGQILDELAALTIGERDRRLVALRREWVGSRFDAVAACPQCGELLEFSLDTPDLPLAPAPAYTTLKLDGRSVEVQAIDPEAVRAILSGPR